MILIMKKLSISNVFNNNLCIFVDASIRKSGESYIGCPGCLVLYNDNFIYDDYIKLDSTNNRSELSAIQLGIQLALKYRHLGENINLFSDSKLCIYSIKEWVFNWLNNMRNDVIYGSSGTPVNNQDIIINIANTILYNNLNINLFHQKGHVVTSSSKSMIHAREVFIESNKIDLDNDVLAIISKYNNTVDRNTKQTLDRYSYVKNKKLSNVIKFSLNNFNENRYKELININGGIYNGKF